MKTSVFYLGLWAMVLGTSCAAGASGTQLPPILRAQVPATGLKKVKLIVGSARVVVVGTSGHKVFITATPTHHWKQTFIFTWHYRKHNPKLASSRRDHIQTDRIGSTLLIRLRHHSSSVAPAPQSVKRLDSKGARLSHNNKTVILTPFQGPLGTSNNTTIKWVVKLPRTMGFSIKGGAGELSISGLSGGVHIKFGVGRVIAHLPVGPIHADLGTGKMQVTIGKKEYHQIHLAAGIGDVALYIEGHKIRKGFAHHFTSAVQNLSGSGNMVYRLSVGVGKIDLLLDPDHLRLK